MSDDDILRDYQRALTADLCEWKRRAEAAESALKRERDELKAQSDERCAMGGPVRWDGHQRPTVCGSCVGDLLHELTEARQTIKTQGGWLDKTVSDRLVADTLRSDLAKCAHERDEARAENAAHRDAQAQVYLALGDGADPDRATWPGAIREMRAEVEHWKLARATAIEDAEHYRLAYDEKKAEVERLKARECPGLEEHDAYQNLSTRALRAEAEVERLRARIVEYQAACKQKDEVVRGAVLTNQDAARYREALEEARFQLFAMLGWAYDPNGGDIKDAIREVWLRLHPAGREQNNDGAKASDPCSVAGSGSVSLRGGGCQDSTLLSPTRSSPPR